MVGLHGVLSDRLQARALRRSQILRGIVFKNGFIYSHPVLACVA